MALLSRSGAVAYEKQGMEQELDLLLNSYMTDVRVVRCDVTDETSLVMTLNALRFGIGQKVVIAGVIHCAGVLRDGLIRCHKSIREKEVVWSAKARGGLLLHMHTLQDPLHLFICCSSVVVALGNIGQFVYAAANAYIDKLVYRRVQQGLPGRSIRWPLVSGMGMGVSVAKHSSQRHDFTAFPLKPSEVESILVDQLTTALDNDIVTIFPSNLLKQSHFHKNPISSQYSNFYVRQYLPSTPSSILNQKVQPDPISAVRSIASSFIGPNLLNDDISLMECGLDSMGAMELASRLSREFDLNLPSVLVFNYPSIREISSYILSICKPAQVHSSSNTLLDSQSATSIKVMYSTAVTGMSCRFPNDVNTLDNMWKVLRTGEIMPNEVPLFRWDSEALIANMDHYNSSACDSIRFGSVLSGDVIESFNNDLFKISSAEAAAMDPGQRLALEVGYEALNDAGLINEAHSTIEIGVFIGALGLMSSSDIHCSGNQNATSSVYDATRAALSVTAGRISFVLGLQGPCFTIDSACSSSLVALHAARQSLHRGECKAALVIGVNILSPALSIPFAFAGMLSPNGHCFTFDERADGYCRAEGCGALVLQKHSSVIEEKKTAYSVIIGCAVRQDGKRASLTAPNGLAQEHLHRAALQDANIQPSEVRHIEAHGTGTSLGDPIEVGALVSVYGSRSGRGRDDPLSVSSVKANMGHLEAAAGMAGLFSAVLALYHGMAPPNAQLRLLNSKIVPIVREEPIAFAVEGVRLKRLSNKPLVAGVSSFGYSGTIASVIL